MDKIKRDRQIKMFLVAVITLTAVIVWYRGRDTGPEYPPDATDEQKAQILKLHKIKKSAADNVEASEEWMGQRLVIKYQPQSIHDGEGWVRNYFTSTLDLMKEIQNIDPDNRYKQILFNVQMPTVDHLGHSGYTRGMLVEYNWDEIKRANWGNLTSWDIANLADKVSFGRLGLESAAEYCMEDSNLKYARNFCLRVVAETQK